ncbi:gibberellin 2-beta-dioxygenase 1 [Quillaja saponaria]|uniref:Gibberellin 2-beta-dioxygenase 1 n=1 Tax=Quillaja saponaria TaxID=32244 RepID=A0AAD7LV57_QUISA|nr:gibberellin 2-beta-dioxygenase 1 [Quillaja saponaria]
MTRSYVFPFIFTSIGVSFSSAHKQEHHQPNMYGGATPAPPPTPSTQPNNLLSMSDVADALSLSRLLHRLPPNLSLPTRRSSTATSPPTISLSSQFPSILNQLHSSASQLGFFQLTDHSIPSELANSAESEALALFNSPRDQKEAYFPKSWPFGYQGNGEEDGDGLSESFCLDGSCSSESAELSLASLRELTHGLEKLGLKTIDLLCESVGFENPIGDQDPTRFCSLMWVSKGGVANGSNPVMTGGSYPFIVGLHYQIRSQKYSLLADSGWVSLLPRVDSVMVTVGDIAQVWSNGKLKKVRGRPLTIFGDEKPKDYSNSSGRGRGRGINQRK